MEQWSDEIIKYAQNAPKCDICKKSFTVTFSGLRDEYAWPCCKCNNYRPTTFILIDK